MNKKLKKFKRVKNAVTTAIKFYNTEGIQLHFTAKGFSCFTFFTVLIKLKGRYGMISKDEGRYG